MMLEKIKEAIIKSGKTRYQIAKDTGVDETILWRLVNGGSCTVQTLDRLAIYLGLDLLPKRRRKRG